MWAVGHEGALLGLRREPWHEDWGPGVSLPSSRPLFWEGGLAEEGRVLWGSPGVLRSWVFGLLDLVLTGVVAGGKSEKDRVWKTPRPERIQFLRLGLNSPLHPHPLFCPSLSLSKTNYTVITKHSKTNNLCALLFLEGFLCFAHCHLLSQ